MDQNQIIVPGINMIIETQRSNAVGPPTAKTAGKNMLSNTPIIKNGRTNNPMSLPLPTRIFNFI